MALTIEEAQKITTEFARRYPVAGVELAYKIRYTLAELYGPFASQMPQSTKGGYVPKQGVTDDGKPYNGIVHIVLNNNTDRKDLIATLQHEVFGHHGINTLSTADRNAFVASIIESRNEPSLRHFWDYALKNYSDRDLEEQAEEVFARQCEDCEVSRHLFHTQAENVLKAIKNSGTQSFFETCINRTRPMRQKDLFNIARMVALGLQDGSRTQQHFPQDHTQLAVNPIKRKRISKNRDFER